MLDQPAVFVDLETTGTNPAYDRVTEIAVIETSAGDVVSEWSTLLDPGCTIPEYIQGLTGITNEMVEGQPRFAEVCENLFEALDGRLLIAHNARFDYGFLRNEFQRAGMRYQSPVLCTVKLSRTLHPEHRRHNLDTIIARHGLERVKRHRAMGDAQAMHAFVRHLYSAHPTDVVEDAISKVIKRQTLPPGLDAADLDTLPDTPGVYLFYDERDILLYVGKSVHLRSRVLSHFSGDHRSSTDARISQQVRRIETIETAGELGALLREAQLIKVRQPVYNRRLRRHKDLCAIQWDADNPNAKPPQVIQAGKLVPAELGRLFGVFRTRKIAQNTLRALAEENGLCLKWMGLEKGKGACFGYQLKKCRGVCIGEEAELQHRLRMYEALSALRLQTWPFEGAIGIRERCEESGRSEVHVVDHWCYMGSMTHDGTPNAPCDTSRVLLEGDAKPAFDLDTYKLLVRHLQKHPDLAFVETPDRIQCKSQTYSV